MSVRENLKNMHKLANNINKKTSEIKNLQMRQRKASQNSMVGVLESANKPNYTNDNFKRNVANMLRIAYNERKPLMNKYNNYRKKYGMSTNVHKPYNRFSLTRTKNIKNNINSINKIIEPYARSVHKGSGAGRGLRYITVGGHYYTFVPNNKLINAIKKRMSASNTIRKALYSPPKVRGTPGGFGPKGGRLYAKLAQRYQKGMK